MSSAAIEDSATGNRFSNNRAGVFLNLVFRWRGPSMNAVGPEVDEKLVANAICRAFGLSV